MTGLEQAPKLDTAMVHTVDDSISHLQNTAKEIHDQLLDCTDDNGSQSLFSCLLSIFLQWNLLCSE